MRRPQPARLLTYLNMPLAKMEKEWKEWILALDPLDRRGGLDRKKADESANAPGRHHRR
jgi:hypothetical protein